MTRPTELPELRTGAIQRLRDGKEAYIAIQMRMGIMDQKVDRAKAEKWYVEEMKRWDKSDLYYVSGEMTDLAAEAVRSMPPFEFRKSDVPSPYGLIYFDRPIAQAHQDQGPDRMYYPVHAALWGFESFTQAIELMREWPEEQRLRAVGDLYGEVVVRSGEGVMGMLERRVREIKKEQAEAGGPFAMASGLWVSIYTMPHPNVLIYDGEIWIPFLSTKHDPATWNLEGSYRSQVLATVRCAWLLMQQKNITEESLAPVPERHSIKRMKRAGFDLRPVRVIQLRKSIASSHADGGLGGREYHHRWMVRSHWRNQWYPKQKRHVPVLVPTHIKGPEGAPLLGGEKVHAWTR